MKGGEGIEIPMADRGGVVGAPSRMKGVDEPVGTCGLGVATLTRWKVAWI